MYRLDVSRPMTAADAAAVASRLPRAGSVRGQVAPAPDGWTIEFAADPADTAGAAELLHTALDIVANEGGGAVRLWVTSPTTTHDELAAGAGLHRERDLLRMLRPLPVDEPFELDTRPFQVGQDEVAWLEVNNAAFTGHPEQSGWDLATIEARETEPWFDTAGFLLHERDGRVAGFCWTKVHAEHTPPIGEIYVIAVHPDFHGRGLGRALVLAGLDHLAGKGITIGMLYVDAANTGAVHLYEHLGFEVDHVDRAYVADVTPTARPTK